MQGQEQEIAILFADIRGFTTLSENKLPYDVVFILNRYFRVMGEAIDAAGYEVREAEGVPGRLAAAPVISEAERRIRPRIPPEPADRLCRRIF